jgi:hypothetical protein
VRNTQAGEDRKGPLRPKGAVVTQSTQRTPRPARDFSKAAGGASGRFWPHPSGAMECPSSSLGSWPSWSEDSELRPGDFGTLQNQPIASDDPIRPPPLLRIPRGQRGHPGWLLG